MKGLFKPNKATNTANYLNAELWGKAFMLEFYEVEKDSDLYLKSPAAVFTFSVPPQNIDISIPQRTNVTKTFGGSVIDDYGNDNETITLSGTTINEEVKLIFTNSLLGNKFLTGSEELLYLKFLIQDSGRTHNVAKRRIKLRKLGTPLVWDVVITDYSIKQSKDNPLAWNYSISFTTIINDMFISNDTAFSGIRSLLNKLMNLLALFNAVKDTIKAIKSFIKKIQDSIDLLFEVIAQFENLTNGLIDEVTNSIKDTQEFIDGIYSSAERITTEYINNLINSGKNLVQACKDFEYWGDLALAGILPDLLNSKFVIEELFGGDWEDFADTTLSIIHDINSYAGQIMYEIKRNNLKIEPIVIPGSTNEDDTVAISYGFTETIVTDGDTWDGLAAKFLGSADNVKILTSYNAQSGIYELTPGKIIYIPILDKETIVNGQNEILNISDVKDNYGTDILIANGDFVFRNGDFLLTSKMNNLSQAINNRLQTTVNTRIRNVVYGIRTKIGDSNDIAANFIRSSIEETIKQDPRIKSIESVDFKGNGQSLNVEVVYTDINGSKNIYQGEI